MSLVLRGQPRPHRCNLLLQSVNAVLALGGVLGCYVSGPAPEPARQMEETVATRLAWIDPRDVPRQYLHLMSAPLAGPYYILVSVSGHYCVVPATVYVVVQENQGWPCNWRLARPVG